MSEDRVEVGDVVEAEVTRKPKKLEPVETTGWRGYPRYSCPKCSFSLLQNPRQAPVKPKVEAHIKEQHA